MDETTQTGVPSPHIDTPPQPLTETYKAPKEPNPTTPSATAPRIIGRRRHYSTLTSSYGPWTNITLTPNETYKTIPLSRGGTLTFRPNVLSTAEQTSLTTAMQNCKLFRQYSFSETYAEPRSHVLLSSKIKSCDKENGGVQPGYVYHGIQMKAYPLDQMPQVQQLANRLAQMHNIEEWNTGVDLIAYKDGDDRIGWHADDTQGESLVLCVVVSCPEPRPLHIRPKKSISQPLSSGDEQIELYPSEGDAYEMDDKMQLGYEHCLPRKKTTSHRFAIVLRNGEEGHVSQDSGREVVGMSPPTHFKGDTLHFPCNEELDLVSLMKKVRFKYPSVTFGGAGCLVEGECYDRRYLYRTFAHRTDQRGVNGNKTIGSDSIVVSRQSSDLREKDGLSWLFYTSTRKQGALGLCKSYTNHSPIRVFRSSKLDNQYAPQALVCKSNQQRTSYRYDGLYTAIKVFDSEGSATDTSPTTSDEQFTFYLLRLGKSETKSSEGIEYLNRLSTEELCHKIQGDQLNADARIVEPLPFPQSDRLPRLSNSEDDDDKAGVNSPIPLPRPHHIPCTDNSLLRMNHRHQRSLTMPQSQFLIEPIYKYDNASANLLGSLPGIDPHLGSSLLRTIHPSQVFHPQWLSMQQSQHLTNPVTYAVQPPHDNQRVAIQIDHLNELRYHWSRSVINNRIFIPHLSAQHFHRRLNHDLTVPVYPPIAAAPIAFRNDNPTYEQITHKTSDCVPQEEMDKSHGISLAYYKHQEREVVKNPVQMLEDDDHQEKKHIVKTPLKLRKDHDRQEKEDMKMLIKLLKDDNRQEKEDMKMLIKQLKDDNRQEKEDMKMLIKQLKDDYREEKRREKLQKKQDAKLRVKTMKDKQMKMTNLRKKKQARVKHTGMLDSMPKADEMEKERQTIQCTDDGVVALEEFASHLQNKCFGDIMPKTDEVEKERHTKQCIVTSDAVVALEAFFASHLQKNRLVAVKRKIWAKNRMKQLKLAKKKCHAKPQPSRQKKWLTSTKKPQNHNSKRKGHMQTSTPAAKRQRLTTLRVNTPNNATRKDQTKTKKKCNATPQPSRQKKPQTSIKKPQNQNSKRKGHTQTQTLAAKRQRLTTLRVKKPDNAPRNDQTKTKKKCNANPSRQKKPQTSIKKPQNHNSKRKGRTQTQTPAAKRQRLTMQRVKKPNNTTKKEKPRAGTMTCRKVQLLEVKIKKNQPKSIALSANLQPNLNISNEQKRNTRRLITPRWENDQERQMKILTPSLVALVPCTLRCGKSRGKFTEVKVTVGLSTTE